jgi:hypothetical protein
MAEVRGIAQSRGIAEYHGMAEYPMGGHLRGGEGAKELYKNSRENYPWLGKNILGRLK